MHTNSSKYNFSAALILSLTLSSVALAEHIVFKTDQLPITVIASQNSLLSQQGDKASYGPSVNADGRYIVFESSSTNLTDIKNTTKNTQLFLKDLLTGNVTGVSIKNGIWGDSPSQRPQISTDGKFITFVSSASNLIGNDTNGHVNDIFRFEISSDSIELVSSNSQNSQSSKYVNTPFISQNGQFIVFEAVDNELVSEDTKGMLSIVLKDMDSHKTELISVNTAGEPANSGSINASISADGRYVVFNSFADNLANDTNSSADIFLRDRMTKTTTRLSVDENGDETIGAAKDAMISEDGRFVVFAARQRNIITGTLSGAYQVYLVNLVTNKIQLISASVNSVPGDRDSTNPKISANGRFVSYVSSATTITNNNPNAMLQLFVYDRILNENVIYSVSDTGKVSDSSIDVKTALSSDGQSLVFSSYSSTLVASDTNLVSDVFIHVRKPATNLPPVAIAGQNQTVVCQANNVQIILDASLSYDPDEDGLEFEWSSNSFGIMPGKQAIVSLSYGTHQVNLTVKDSRGGLATDGITIFVDDIEAPEIVTDPLLVLEADSKVGVSHNISIIATDNCSSPVQVSFSPSMSIFPLGSTSLTVNAKDGAGNIATQDVLIQVQDTTAPTLLIPGDITAEAEAIQTFVDIGSASASDIFEVLISNNAPGLFPLGKTTVTWVAKDSNNNSTLAEQIVLVQDTIAPTIFAGEDVILEATHIEGAPYSFKYEASDSCNCAPLTITAAPTFSFYPLGDTVVTISAIDQSGNTNSDDLNIKVQDTTPPSLIIPTNIEVEATGLFTQITLGKVKFDDIFPVTLEQQPLINEFPLGSTDISWIARDANGNQNSKVQTVTVVDTTAPTLIAPANIQVEATAVLTPITLEQAKADDIFSVTLEQQPLINEFPLGSTDISWIARDANGNQNSKVQTVTV
ncbi:MAG: HYR domain-containing protein, partial [Gammaproteobacteria bacterium]|nr:HYR domain-containing protein [Gammaproteobacteria bacterium]